MSARLLYNRDILRLAAMLIPDEHLAGSSASAEARSPTCGSRIAVDILLDDNDTIADLAFRAHACALGQASTAIVRAHAKGHDRASIMAMRGILSARLRGANEIGQGWPQLELLTTARDFPARHAAILLPFDALLLAFEAAG